MRSPWWYGRLFFIDRTALSTSVQGRKDKVPSRLDTRGMSRDVKAPYLSKGVQYQRTKEMGTTQTETAEELKYSCILVAKRRSETSCLSNINARALRECQNHGLSGQQAPPGLYAGRGIAQTLDRAGHGTSALFRADIALPSLGSQYLGYQSSSGLAGDDGVAGCQCCLRGSVNVAERSMTVTPPANSLCLVQSV